MPNLIFLNYPTILVIFFVLFGAESRPPQRIKGGENATFHDYPYMMFLKDIKSMTTCAGILISEKYALTAAHCVTERTTPIRLKPTSSLRLFIGNVDLRRPGTWYKLLIQKIYVHENWKGIFSNRTGADIAVVELNRSLNLKWDIKAAPLTNSPIDPWTEGIIIGWGSSKNGGELNPLMQRARTVTITQNYCRFFHNYRLSNQTFCTLGRDRNVSICQGDSGGPFINPEGEVAGIISYTRKCSGAYPNIFTDVFSYKSWIEIILRGEMDESYSQNSINGGLHREFMDRK